MSVGLERFWTRPVFFTHGIMGLKGPCETSSRRSKYCFPSIFGHLMCSQYCIKKCHESVPSRSSLVLQSSGAFPLAWLMSSAFSRLVFAYVPILFMYCRQRVGEKSKLSGFQHSSGHSAHYILFLLQVQLTMPGICLLKSGSSLHFCCSPICSPRDLFVSFVITHPVHYSIQTQVLASRSSFCLECLPLPFPRKF